MIFADFSVNSQPIVIKFYKYNFLHDTDSQYVVD